MQELFPIIISSIAITIFGGIEIGLLALLNRPWWRTRWIRRTALLLPVGGITLVALWGLAAYNSLDWLATVAALGAVLAFVCEVALMLSLPLSGMVHLVGWVMSRMRPRPKQSDAPVDLQRRALLRTTAAALPTVAVGLGLAGVGRALACVNVYQRSLPIPGWPKEAGDLKILHLSDIHLGPYVQLDDLQQVLTDAQPFAPDLVLVTGDIADDLDQLPEALRMIANLKAPLGAYACLGNHEHFRGLRQVRQIFEASSVPLLINQSVTLATSSGRAIDILGIDDPRRMRGNQDQFFEQALDAVGQESSVDSLKILMSHRPSVFPLAAARGIDITLAGHTHGAQLGFAERSILEPMMPQNYLWGHYQNGAAQLYTSAGTGHWFPFRLGCPQEAPILVVEATK